MQHTSYTADIHVLLKTIIYFTHNRFSRIYHTEDRLASQIIYNIRIP